MAGGGGGTDGPAGADRGAAAPRAREVLPLVGEGLGAQREPQTRSMPPKGKKAYRTDADLPADWSSVTIELRGGEKDPQKYKNPTDGLLCMFFGRDSSYFVSARSLHCTGP